MRHTTRLADAALSLVALIWGVGFVATEYALRAHLSTPLIMALRFFVAALTMLPFCLKRLRGLTKATLLRGVCIGGVLCAAFFAQTYGQSLTSVSNSAFITATNVIMVPFMTWLITRKAPPIRYYWLALLALVGVALLTGGVGNLGVGDGFVLASAALFALHITWLGTWAKGHDPLVMTFLQMATACALSCVALATTPVDITRIDAVAGLWAVLYLGCLSTCLCFFLQTWAQQHTSPAKAGILLCAEGLFGSLCSVLLGLDAFTWHLLAGGVTILACVLLTEAGFSRRTRPSPRRH